MAKTSDITIVDVARTAGVGVGTVSRVINRRESVRPETVALVQRAMDDLGYTPPRPERRRGPRIGKPRPRADLSVMMLIMGNQGLKWVMNCAPVYSYVLHGIEAALTEKGRNMIVRNAPNWKAVREVLPRNRIEGLIILGSDSDVPPPGPLREIAAVWAMGTPRLFQGDHVHPDNTKVGVLAAQYLLEKGHTHCAYLGAHSGPRTLHDWGRGDAFVSTITEAGGRVEMLVDPQLVIRSPDANAVNEDALTVQLDRLLAMNPRPTALMLQADLYAPSVYRQLLARGICPQRDIAIVTCNNERPYLNSLRPIPAIVDLQAETIGRRAVDQLMWRLQNPGAPAMRVMVAPTLIPPPEDNSPCFLRSGNGDSNGHSQSADSN